MSDKSYSISSRTYLARANARLAEETLEALVYAALEIRCGVEARLREYLDPQEHIPPAKRMDWRIGHLHRTATAAFQLGDEVARVRISHPALQTLHVDLFYTPVPQRLRTLAERAGNILHAPKTFRDAGDPFWSSLRSEVEEAAGLLADATTGTLLGPMLINKDTGESHMPIELLPGDEADVVPILRQLRGVTLELEILYFPTLAAAQLARPSTD